MAGMPGPVLAATAVVVAAAVAAAVTAGPVGLIIAGLCVAIAVGLWQGYRGALWVAVFIAALNVISGLVTLASQPLAGMARLAAGLAVVLLLLAPASSRVWFRRP